MGVPIGLLLASGVTADGGHRAGRCIRSVGLARAVPAVDHPDPLRLLPPGGGEPGGHRDRRAQREGEDADHPTLQEAHPAGDHSHPRVRRKQHGGLHDRRRLHPELLHQPGGPGRPRTRAGAAGGHDLGSVLAGVDVVCGLDLGQARPSHTYILGWILQLVGVFALFPIVNAGDVVLLTVALAILTIRLGFTYGPQAAMYSELFPASIRFSGVSISYAIGAIVGGTFAPRSPRRSCRRRAQPGPSPCTSRG